MPRIEITVVENGIIVEHEGIRWVYRDMSDFFSHNAPVVGDHFLLIIEKVPESDSKEGKWE